MCWRWVFGCGTMCWDTVPAFDGGLNDSEPCSAAGQSYATRGETIERNAAGQELGSGG
jgi:hypothetical protein